MQRLYVLLGWLSLTLGVIGIFVPLLPTVPFVLLSSYLFSKGSHKIHRWLVENPRFGPAIHDWEQHGVIRKSAKIRATFLLLLTLTYLLFFKMFLFPVKLLILGMILSVLIFLWTRPSR